MLFTIFSYSIGFGWIVFFVTLVPYIVVTTITLIKKDKNPKTVKYIKLYILFPIILGILSVIRFWLPFLRHSTFLVKNKQIDQSSNLNPSTSSFLVNNSNINENVDLSDIKLVIATMKLETPLDDPFDDNQRGAREAEVKKINWQIKSELPGTFEIESQSLTKPDIKLHVDSKSLEYLQNSPLIESVEIIDNDITD